MIKRIKAFLLPFSSIASDLSIIRQLYELELQSRNPPIMRVTESPNEDDTQVTYVGEKDGTKSKLRKLMEGDPLGEDDDEGNVSYD